MKKQKALFIDRDGIINVDHGYVYKIEDFEFTKDIFTLLHLFVAQGYLLFIVTNQSGIGRGYYTLEAFETLNQWLMERFQANGIEIQEIEYCPHTPHENCKCRKPLTGMIENILTKYPVDLQHSWMIGDKQSDMDLALNAHIGSSIAINPSKLENATYSFSSIEACAKYLEENKDKII